MAADVTIQFNTSLDPSAYQKGLKEIESSHTNFKKTLIEVGKIGMDAFGGKQQAQIERMTQKLDKQSESIVKQTNKIKNLQQDYDKLVKSGGEPKSLVNMRKELTGIDTKTEEIIRKNDEIAQKYNEAEAALSKLSSGQAAFAQVGDTIVTSVEQARTMVTQLEAEFEKSVSTLESMSAKAQELDQNIQRVEIKPETSDEAERLKQKLDEATMTLERMSREAEITDKNLRDLSGVKVEPIPSEMLENVNAELEIAKAKNEELLQQYELLTFALKSLSEGSADFAKMSEAGVGDYDRVADELRNVYDELTRNEQKIEELTQKSKALPQTLTSELSEESQAFENLNNNLDKHGNKINDASESERKKSDQSKNLTNSLNNENNAFQRNAAIINVLNSAFNKFMSVLGGIGKMTSRAALGIGKIAVGITNIGKQSGHASNAVEKLLQRILRLAIGALVFNVIRRGFSQLRKYIYAAMKTNDEFVANLQAIQVNLKTAFQPIFTAVMPAVNALLSAIATATAYLAQLFSMLGGTTVQASRDAAKAMDQQAAATKAAGGAAQKATGQIAGFDKINQQSADTAGGAGAAIEEMFADVPIMEFDTSPMEKFIDRLKNMFKDVDLEYWSGIGALIGDKIVTSLKKIPWEKIKTGVNTLAKNLAAIINGVLGTEGLGKEIGITLAEIVNTISGFFLTLGDGIDFKQAGVQLGEAIGGFFETWDAGQTADALNVWALGILTALETALDTVPWFTVGEKIGDFLFGIQWREIFSKAWDVMRAAFLATFDLASGLANAAGWTNLSTSFNKLKETIEPVLDKIGTILLWLWDEVMTPFVDWLMDTLLPAILDNIVEPMVDAANTVMDISAPAITYLWENVMKPFATWVSDVFIDILNRLGEIYRSVFGAAKEETSALQKIFEGFAMAVHAAYNVFIAPALNAMKILVDVVFGFVKEQIELIKSVAQGVVEFISGVFTADWDKAWNGLKGVFTGIVNYIIGMFESLVNTVVGLLNGLVGTINGLISGINVIPGLDIPKIPTIPKANIPRLATGGLIPPNNPRLFVMGDAREEEIVSPRSAIKEEVLNALSEFGGNDLFGDTSQTQTEVVLELDGDVLGSVLMPILRRENRLEGRRVGAMAAII